MRITLKQQQAKLNTACFYFRIGFEEKSRLITQFANEQIVRQREAAKLKKGGDKL
jgi:hypothetical protein